MQHLHEHNMELYEQVQKYIHDQTAENAIALVEWYTSEEVFIESCEANGYTFRENGEMENI